MPQMMPIYWLVIFLMVNLFLHFFFSFHYHNLIFFSSLSSPKMEKKDVGKWSFLK